MKRISQVVLMWFKKRIPSDMVLRMKTIVNLKFITVGQAVIGVVLVVFPILMEPHIGIVATAPSDFSAVLSHVEHDRPRAAEIMETQQESLQTLKDVTADLFCTFQICGLFMLFSALALILQFRGKKLEPKDDS